MPSFLQLSLPTVISTGEEPPGPTGTPGTIGWELFAYDYADWKTLLCQVPRWITLTFTKMVNDKGSGSIQLNLDDAEFWGQTLGNGQPASYLIDSENLWQVRYNGTPIFEFLGETIQEQLVDKSEQRIVSVTGPGGIQVLTWARAMPPGFPDVIFKTDAISDSFDEVDSNGNPELDMALWNLATPLDQISLVPAGSAGAGSSGINASSSYFYLGTVYLSPADNTVYLGAGTYDITSSVLSAQVLPMVGSLDGSQQSAMYVQSVSNPDGYALMAVSVAGLYCQVGFIDGASPVTKSLGPYNATTHAYWQITEQGGAFYFWTSQDDQNWVLQWSVAHGWDAAVVNVWFTATYDDSGPQMGVSSLNSDVVVSTASGNLYYNLPIMAIWLDQLTTAQARGTIPWVTGRVTAKADSFGQAWPDLQSVQIANGTDLYSLLQAHCALVNADFIMQPGFVLQVGLPNSTPTSGGLGIGTDLSKQVVFREGKNEQTKSRTRARDAIANLIGSQNEDNTIVTAEDTDSITQWHQREGWITTGATVTEAANQTAAEASVDQTSDEVMSWTMTVSPDKVGAVPFQDYDVGDWIGIEEPGPGASTVDVVRVVAIGIQVNAQGIITPELTLNSYRQWVVQQLQYLANKFGGQLVSTQGTTTITNQTGNPRGLPSVVSPSLGGLGDVIVSP